MGITQGHVVLWSRFWMLLDNCTKMLDAITPLLYLGVRATQPVMGDQRHIFLGQQLKQEGDSFGRSSLGKVEFSLPQHDDRIVGP